MNIKDTFRNTMKTIICFLILITTTLPVLSQADENIVWEAETINHADMDISPNDSLIAATYIGGPGGSNKIGIYDLKTGNILRTLESPGGYVQSISFSYDGKYLVSAGEDDFFIVWKVDDWSIYKKISISSSGFYYMEVFDIKFSNTNYLIALGGAGNYGVLVYDLSKGLYTNKIKHLSSAESVFTGELCFSFDDKYLAISNQFNPMRIINLADGSDIPISAPEIKPITFSPEGKYFAVELEEYIQLYDAQTFAKLDKFIFPEKKNIQDINFSNDGKYIIVTRPTEIWDIENRTSIKHIPIGGYNVKFTSDNKYVVISGSRLLLYKSGLKPTAVNEIKNTTLEYYPNPSGNSINIKFDLEVVSDVKLSLNDMTGNEILLLKEGLLEPGEHNLSFDITNIPNGAYLINFRYNDNLLSKKIIIER